MSKKKLTNKHLVLDLDSTLICSDMNLSNLKKLNINKNNELNERIYRFDVVDYDEKNEKIGNGIIVSVWGVYRPFLFEFIKFSGDYFEAIHIWSAGTYKYVHGIKEIIFKNNEIQPKNVFTREDCHITNKNVFKPLSKLFLISKKLKPHNTLIIDDRTDTFSKNKDNGILIPKYEPNFTKTSILEEDICLLQLIEWLSSDEVKNSEDVRKLDKSKIFEITLLNNNTKKNKNYENMSLTEF